MHLWTRSNNIGSSGVFASKTGQRATSMLHRTRFETLFENMSQ